MKWLDWVRLMEFLDTAIAGKALLNSIDLNRVLPHHVSILRGYCVSWFKRFSQSFLDLRSCVILGGIRWVACERQRRFQNSF
jgi:hypothetical protein